MCTSPAGRGIQTGIVEERSAEQQIAVIRDGALVGDALRDQVLAHRVANASLTLQVYAQVIQRQRVDYDLVWKLMRFNDEPETWQAPRRGGNGHRIGQMPTVTEPVATR